MPRSVLTYIESWQHSETQIQWNYRFRSMLVLDTWAKGSATSRPTDQEKQSCRVIEKATACLPEPQGRHTLTARWINKERSPRIGAKQWDRDHRAKENHQSRMAGHSNRSIAGSMGKKTDLECWVRHIHSWWAKNVISGKVDLQYSLRQILANCSNLQEEETAVQHIGKQLGVTVLLMPKFHADLAGEGIEYSWAHPKAHYRCVPVSRKLGRDNFKQLV